LAYTHHTDYFIHFLDFKREKLGEMSFLPLSSIFGHSELSSPALVAMDPNSFIHFPSSPTPIPLVVQHWVWREVQEVGEASEEVQDGANEVAVVKEQHL
jgi:hypothetical protein